MNVLLLFFFVRFFLNGIFFSSEFTKPVYLANLSVLSNTVINLFCNLRVGCFTCTQWQRDLWLHIVASQATQNLYLLNLWRNNQRILHIYSITLKVLKGETLYINSSMTVKVVFMLRVRVWKWWKPCHCPQFPYLTIFQWYLRDEFHCAPQLNLIKEIMDSEKHKWLASHSLALMYWSLKWSWQC